MDLTKGSIPRIFIKYLIPSISSMIGLSLYILVDTIFIGRGIGVDGLTALNISLPVFTMFLCLGHLLNMGGSTVYAVLIGQKNYKQAQEVFTLSLISGIVIALLFTSISLYYLDELCWFLGSSEKVFQMVRDYSKILIVFSSAFIINSVLSGFIRNDHAPKLCMVAGLSGNFMNIVLDYLFIFVFHWGIVGAVYATVLSPVFSILILLSHFFSKNNQLKLVIPTAFIEKLYRIVKNGFPSLLDSIAPGIVIYFFNQTLLKLNGDSGVAAYSVIANISFIGNVMFIGTAQAMQPVSSQNYGAKQMIRVRNVYFLALVTALFFAIIKTGVILAFPEAIVKLFNTESTELIKIAGKGLMIYFSAMPFVAINVVSVVYLQSIEKSLPALMITLCRTIGLILIGLMILPRYFGMTGVWMIVPLAELSSTLLVVSYMKFKKALR